MRAEGFARASTVSDFGWGAGCGVSVYAPGWLWVWVRLRSTAQARAREPGTHFRHMEVELDDGGQERQVLTGPGDSTDPDSETEGSKGTDP